MSNNQPIKHHRVAFVLRNNSCFMVPGHIVVGAGDTIRFSVVGKINTVQIYFPNTSIFAPVAGLPVITLSRQASPPNPANPAQDMDIASAAVDGVYPFTAYCVETGSFVIGGSDPEIIIQT